MKMAINDFFSRYRDVILFNKNLIISAVAGFLASAYVTELYSQYGGNDNNINFANSIAALGTESAVYLPLFALLFYIDNRQKYIDSTTGKKNSNQIRQDIKKLLVAFSISEVIFSITRVLTQYQLLQLSNNNIIQPYEASMISSLTAWAIFFVAINAIAKNCTTIQKDLVLRFYPAAILS